MENLKLMKMSLSAFVETISKQSTLLLFLAEFSLYLCIINAENTYNTEIQLYLIQTV
jgi:hypothetical protein